MPNILVADKLAQQGIEILKEKGCQPIVKTGLSPKQLIEALADCEGIIVRSQTKLTAEIINNAPKLKVIGRAGVGLDNVDLEAATKRGIIVMNAPGGNTISTCEHTFALILALARKIPYAYQSLKQGEWNRSAFKGVELYGKTLGIIGLGRIGKEVAKRAQAFAMNVIVYDPFITLEVAEQIGVKLVELEELFKQADIITIHTPLTANTRNLVNKNTLSLMKKSAFLVNCARGEIVDEQALIEALKNKHIAGAALDVFPQEPPTNKELLNLDNIIVTPHLGASTEEAQVNVAIEIAECISDALISGIIRNAANYIQLDPETYKKITPYMSLVENMGKFLSQYINGRAEEIQINYIGEIANYKIDPLGMEFTKAFLKQTLEEDVNLVNAFSLARERGIKIEQTKVNQEEEYVNLIRVIVKTNQGNYRLEGTLFSNRQPRFVRVDDFHIEIAPSQYMLVINNQDKPGVIGNLGMILADYNINIANMSLGRKEPQGLALTVLNLDNPLNEEIIAKIKENSHILSLKFMVF